MLKGFRDFLLRGNVIDLAVGIVVGGAFTAVVTGLMDGMLTPLIALIFGEPDISHVGITLSDTFFPVGLFLQAVLTFLLVATALYFCVVVPVKRATDWTNKKKASKPAEAEAEPAAEEPSPDVALLTEIRDLLAGK